MSNLNKLAAKAFFKMAVIVDPPKPTVPLQMFGDEFIDWLSYANAGMLNPGNVALMDFAVKNLPTSAPMLEIGSCCGLSANVLTHLKRRTGVKNALITSDKWDFERDKSLRCLPGSSVEFSDYRNFIRDSYLRNIQFFSADDLPATIELLSDEFFQAWRERQRQIDVLGRPIDLGGPLSFCYIDGNHTLEYSRRDFYNTDEFLDVGGFILFDDSNIDEFEVHQLMPEVIDTMRYKVITTSPNYLFQKLSHKSR